MPEGKAQWEKDILLRSAARDLALLVAQSPLYSHDWDVRDLVDDVLGLTKESSSSL